MSNKNNENFKEGLKTTGLFGGVQVFKILISIINTKLVAVLLGPIGVGISGLLSSTVGIISNVATLGLGTSAVRDVSAAYADGDTDKFSKIVTVFRKIVWATGMMGLIVCLLGAPLWSHIAFDNYDYTLAFAVLSITILLGQISMGQGVVLRGARKFKQIAQSGIVGSIIGLFTGIPFYFFWGIKGIVPSMILSSISGICLTYYYSRKIKIKKISLSVKEIWSNGSLMIKLGVFVTMQSFLNLLCGYIIRIYISHVGGVEDVGLYSSGFNIINTYVGMVFSAMAMDYYPRLSSFSHDKMKFADCINQQAELSLLLISPLIIVFLLLGGFFITILYSSKFTGATLMVMFGMMGIFFKAPSWCLGFTFLAKGDTKAFFYNEIVSELYMLVINILFYRYWGLNGLGGAFLFGYILYLAQCYFVCKFRYGFNFELNLCKIMLPQVLLSIAMFLVSVYISSCIKYFLLGPILCICSFLLVYRELDKKVNVMSYVKKYINRLC